MRQTFFHTRYILIENKDKEKYTGKVYNLSVWQDESYVTKIGITHNCRCNTVEVLASDYTKDDSAKAIAKGEKATTQIGKNGKNKAEMFRFNPGAEKRIFPPKNAYTPKHCKGGKVDMSGLIGVASIVLSLEDEKCQAKKLLEDEYKKITIYPEVNRNSNDYKGVLESAEFFAKEGRKVEVLPNFHGGAFTKDYKKYFSDLINTKYEGKCPDLRLNGVYYEHENFITSDPKKALKNMLNGGLKQSSHLIIEDCGISESYIVRNIKTRIFVEKQDIEEVWLKQGKELKLLFKNAKTP